jgi:hypothetical protein
MAPMSNLVGAIQAPGAAIAGALKQLAKRAEA